MNSYEWKNQIKAAAAESGTYQKQYDSVINALADILEQRDLVYAQYVEEGCQATVTKTSDRGAVNTGKNPLLSIWMDLNRDALAYWRDLGLTPAGLKRINESAVKGAKKESALEKALAKLT